MSLESMAVEAKKASVEIARASSCQKNKALEFIIEGLQDRQEEILKTNKLDILEGKAAGLSPAMIDRLSLENRLDGIQRDIEGVIRLSDPVGECYEEQFRGGLCIKKRRVPIGVLGIIYEARPNVTIDTSILAVKSGNCAILRGGSETLRTNRILVEVIQKALALSKMSYHAVQMISNADRGEVMKMLRLHECIDLIIPRGGAALHRFCRENSAIPVITGGVGVCHLFVDESAQIEKSLQVILNAKTQRPTVCNALDTLLVHEDIAEDFIPQVVDILSLKGVKFRLDARSMQFVQGKIESHLYRAAQPEDWDTEWLSLEIGIKVVKDIEDGIEHIKRHSTGHSDGILTQDKKNADLFVAEVDSAAVYVNASTRFTDGGQLGLGAEVAISTQKLHARGPMGLRELTSYKWVISGDYAVRE